MPERQQYKSGRKEEKLTKNKAVSTKKIVGTALFYFQSCPSFRLNSLRIDSAVILSIFSALLITSELSIMDVLVLVSVMVNTALVTRSSNSN
ncbi:MAG: hypothetical protein H6Q75_481 [Firmicutes bacterium]|nr:hypothetical protein [Bacillota bacterium]